MMPFCAAQSEENFSCVSLGTTVDDEIVGLSEARFEQVVAGCGVSSLVSGAELPLEHAVVKHKRPPMAAASNAWLAVRESPVGVMAKSLARFISEEEMR